MSENFDTLLCRKFSVGDYRKFESQKNRHAIAEFMMRRFQERYLDPIHAVQFNRSGFLIIAVACLMIEALESFHEGLPNTDRKSRLVFRAFFSRWPQFKSIHEHSDIFYRHVRCGILHQAETTGGWRIWRKGPLFDATNKTINASLFLAALRDVLSRYVAALEQSPWESAIWRNFRRKMDAVCQNTSA